MTINSPLVSPPLKSIQKINMLCELMTNHKTVSSMMKSPVQDSIKEQRLKRIKEMQSQSMGKLEIIPPLIPMNGISYFIRPLYRLHIQYCSHYKCSISLMYILNSFSICTFCLLFYFLFFYLLLSIFILFFYYREFMKKRLVSIAQDFKSVEFVVESRWSQRPIFRAFYCKYLISLFPILHYFILYIILHYSTLFYSLFYIILHFYSLFSKWISKNHRLVKQDLS